MVQGIERRMHKVMLIEDDPTMLSLLETLMEIEGFAVNKVVDFSQAHIEVREYHPDLVLLDVHLHEFSGLDILRHLREDKGLAELKIVMSSGMDMETECLQKGANEFVLKPYMPDELISKIKIQLGE